MLHEESLMTEQGAACLCPREQRSTERLEALSSAVQLAGARACTFSERPGCAHGSVKAQLREIESTLCGA